MPFKVSCFNPADEGFFTLASYDFKHRLTLRNEYQMRIGAEECTIAAKVGLLSEKRRAPRDAIANNVAGPEALGRGDVDAVAGNTALDHALGPTDRYDGNP
jgi:hypothetical protein